MAETWPLTLPQSFLVSGFGEGVGDALVEYAPEAGPSMTRRRSTAVARPLSGAMNMTGAQLATFRTFFADTIVAGSLPFEFPDQVAVGTLLVKFTKSAPPSWSKLGPDAFRLSLSLMVLP